MLATAPLAGPAACAPQGQPVKLSKVVKQPRPPRPLARSPVLGPAW
jgi:hypothetical protein